MDSDRHQIQFLKTPPRGHLETSSFRPRCEAIVLQNRQYLPPVRADYGPGQKHGLFVTFLRPERLAGVEKSDHPRDDM